MRKYCGYCGSLKVAEDLSSDTSQQAVNAGEEIVTIEVPAGVFSVLSKDKPVIVWGDGDWEEYGDAQEKDLQRILKLKNVKFTRQVIGEVGKAAILNAVKKSQRYAENKGEAHSMEILLLMPEDKDSQINSFIPTGVRSVPNRKPLRMGDVIVNVKKQNANQFERFIPYLASLKNTAVEGDKTARYRRRLTER